MGKRFVSIWFRYLTTDWHCRRQPSLKGKPFVLTAPDHGRMVVTALNAPAEKEGIYKGMAVADARAIFPSLAAVEDDATLPQKLLTRFAKWMIRYSPFVALDLPDGIIVDATGCSHLWGGDKAYIEDIHNRIDKAGYKIKIAMADTAGAAWAVAHYGDNLAVTEAGRQHDALLNLPPAALRIEMETAERLEKLGLRKIQSFINMPETALKRRFGQYFLKRLYQALGTEEEMIEPVMPILPYQERLPCLEPIVTATGIQIALQQLMDALCNRLKKEEKGLRIASFKGFRIDGKIEMVQISTNRPSCNRKHLLQLFEIKTGTIEPALGIELFTLEALKVEPLPPLQEKLWDHSGVLEDAALSELLDRIEMKMGGDKIHRYVPNEHYWPERSFQPASSLNKISEAAWNISKPRPLQLLPRPVAIQVTAPVPDYPPMNFRYKGSFHKVIKADGPERIEQEWWLQEGQHRDYYCVEDENGCRYWLFRSGHYDAERTYQWFIHGFFA